MESVRELFRVGHGPSSSHTMAPRTAAQTFLARYPQADRFEVTLYGSLAATGRGHLTDTALREALLGKPLLIHWKPEECLPLHPNGMRFVAFGPDSQEIGNWEVYSVGGGKIADSESSSPRVYPMDSLTAIMEECDRSGISFWEYVQHYESPDLFDYLADVRRVMLDSLQRGLHTEGVLPGGLGLARYACRMLRKAQLAGEQFRRTGFLAAYAHAVSEENAARGLIATAPTCGACGVLPAVLRYVQEMTRCSDGEILRSLATAGLIGNLVKHNAGISGAEVGCQGEVGTACSMAAAAATQLLGGSIRQIEYAAEMGMEHHLGLTCDPVMGMVQIPCIERNAHAATRAMTCAEYAIFGDGTHRISFDVVVRVMGRTGRDLPSLYRETSIGGLAKAYRERGLVPLG